MRSKFKKYKINQSEQTLIIHSARGPEFVSNQWNDLCSYSSNIRISMCQPNRPEQNGVCERMHRTLKSQLIQIGAPFPKTIKCIAKFQALLNKRARYINTFKQEK